MRFEHCLWMPHFGGRHINHDSPRVHLKSVYFIKYYPLQELIKHIKRTKLPNPISSTPPHPPARAPRPPQPRNDNFLDYLADVVFIVLCHCSEFRIADLYLELAAIL